MAVPEMPKGMGQQPEKAENTGRPVTSNQYFKPMDAASPGTIKVLLVPGADVEKARECAVYDALPLKTRIAAANCSCGLSPQDIHILFNMTKYGGEASIERSVQFIADKDRMVKNAFIQMGVEIERWTKKG